MNARFRQHSLVMLIMLAAQYILGMILNLFVALPDKHPGQSGNYFVRSAHSFGWAVTLGGGVVLFLHVLLGVGLIVRGIIMLVDAARNRSVPWIWVGAVGLLGIAVAFTNGLSFLDFNRDADSFIMAMGYVVATAAYFAGLFMRTGNALKPAKR
jgi:uncharacterized membrane protein HdeD (DUF308 family)